MRLKSRELYQCRRCRFQFSLTTATALHRSRVELPVWFAAAERIIRYEGWGCDFGEMPAQQLAEEMGVAYVTARRMRKVIIHDVSLGGPGLLRAAVCTERVILPVNLEPGIEYHLMYLGRS